ncbi:MAG: hypothetical protein ACKVPZ_03310 [Burkholderiaceae bacterium]
MSLLNPRTLMNCSKLSLLFLHGLLLTVLHPAYAQSASNGEKASDKTSDKASNKALERVSTADKEQATDAKRFFNSEEWFLSWGYNKTHYSKSNINVSQPSLGNDFTVNAVQGHDEFSRPTCCSPDNLRWGRYLDEARVYALDVSLDHTKYTSTLGQVAFVSGKNSAGVGNQVLSSDYFTYMLHNGLNHVMVNLSYRKPLLGSLNETGNLSFIGKVGTGLAVVHPFNVMGGNENQMGKKTLTNALGFNNGWWRIVGTSTGLELGMRYVLMKPYYVEWINKQVFTSMSNIPVFQGSASQNLRSNEIIFNLGYTFNAMP